MTENAHPENDRNVTPGKWVLFGGRVRSWLPTSFGDRGGWDFTRHNGYFFLYWGMILICSIKKISHSVLSSPNKVSRDIVLTCKREDVRQFSVFSCPNSTLGPRLLYWAEGQLSMAIVCRYIRIIQNVPFCSRRSHFLLRKGGIFLVRRGGYASVCHTTHKYGKGWARP